MKLRPIALLFCVCRYTFFFCLYCKEKNTLNEKYSNSVDVIEGVYAREYTKKYLTINYMFFKHLSRVRLI